MQSKLRHATINDGQGVAIGKKYGGVGSTVKVGINVTKQGDGFHSCAGNITHGVCEWRGCEL